jgi:hypothetical protein
MAIFRDPLDELIADLERSVPTAAAAEFDIPPMEDYCVLGQMILSRDPAERLRLADDPAVKRVMAYHERLAREWQSSRPVEPQT